MRKLIMFTDVSLDGFMAGPDNDLVFMIHDEELDRELTADLMRTVDTMLVGGGSYPGMAGHWPHADGPIAQWMNATPKVVFSSTLKDLSWQNSTLAEGDLATVVDDLKGRPGGDIVVFGGVRIVRSLVALGAIDEYRLKVNPVALGAGEAVFSDATCPIQLELLRARTFPSGKTALEYTAT